MLVTSLEKSEYWVSRLGDNIFSSQAKNWPREFLIYYCLVKLRKMAGNGTIELGEDLVYGLLPLWGAERPFFFEKSHERFKDALVEVAKIGGEYFNEAKAALVDNNRILLEQKSLMPSIVGLKYPPIFCGDFNTRGSPEFGGIEDHYMSVPEAQIAELIRIKELREL